MPSPVPEPRKTVPLIDDDDGLPKYARVAAAVRRQIADGALRPGQPAPSGAALSRVTGYSTLTCRRGLRALIADGVLVPGPSRNARPRVAAGPLFQTQRDQEQRDQEQRDQEQREPRPRDLGDAARALSSGLAERRRAAGLTQPDLAALAGVSVTTIGHAETGRLWQSRLFWERADAVLGAAGALLRSHDAYQAAGAAAGRQEPGSWVRPPKRPPGDIGVPADLAARAQRIQPGVGPPYVLIVWADGTVTLAHPPGAAGARVS